MDALFYMAAQFLGGLLAGFLIYLLNPAQAGYCYRKTFPHMAVGRLVDGMIFEFLATFFLVFMVFGTAVDKRAPPSIYGFAIGGTVLMSAVGIGHVTGGSLNPTRYLGPWIISLFGDSANKDPVCVKANESQPWEFLVYLVASPAGGIAGGALYNFVFLEA